MTSMFWGLRLEPGKRYSTTVGKSFHVSMAALDCASVKNENEVNSVMLEETESSVPFILCSLQKQKNLQCPLDLNFMTGDRITFFCKGNATIHLSGYVHEDPDDDEYANLLGEEEEDEEEEDEEEEEEGDEDSNEEKQLQANGLSGKRKTDNLAKKAKRAKLQTPEDDSDEDDADDLTGMKVESDDEDDEDDEDEEEEESEDEEEETPPQKQKQQQKNTNKLTEKQAQNGLQTSKKDKKKGGAAQQKPEAAAQQTQQKNEGAVRKTIQGGVQVKDLRVGTGPVCKAGQKANVYYVGRLKDSNKVFDSARKGSGFTFTVGKGEVIKAWDIGVAGMKVGGKRTIISPPNMAYGQRGSPPTIPPNSTLIFDVELRSIK